MEEDLKEFEKQDCANICLVRVLDDNGMLVPDHVVFNYWVGSSSITFLAYKTKTGKYIIKKNNIVLLKNIKLTNLSKNMKRFKPFMFASCVRNNIILPDRNGL